MIAKKSQPIAKTGWHRIINNVLSVVVVCLAVYITVWPFLPAISLWWRQQAGDGYAYQSRLAPDKKTNRSKPIPKDNRLVVPRLRLDEAINEGATTAALNQGVWRRPATAQPNQIGNSVLVGHRFTYSGSAVFYNLDKIQPGDPIIIYWQGREYDYTVSNIQVVSANAAQVEAQTTDRILTLYTCTPLWSAKDRLVIIAKPRTP